MKYVVCLAFAAALALESCSRPAPAASPSPSPSSGPPIVLAVVREGSDPVSVSGFGTVGGGPNAQASLAFPQAGRIASVDVSVGQRVAAGDALARLDPRPFQADLDQSEAALASAQANYQKVAAGARPQQIAQTDAQIAAARTQLSVAQAKLARQEKLLNVGVTARADVEAARAEVASASSALRVLEQQQSAQRSPWAPDVASARAAVAQAAAQVSASRQKLDASVLRAPFAGIVTGRLHQDGESVDSTSAVIGLSRSKDVVFTAQFAPSDADRVHAGDRAMVQLSGASSDARGHVVAINPAQSAEARTVPVLIAIEGRSLTSGPGAYGKATIQVASRPGLYVPSGAVVSDPTTGTTQVFHKTRDGFTPVKVEVTSETSGRSWVSSPGLHAGDSVVSEGAYALLAPPPQSSHD